MMAKEIKQTVRAGHNTSSIFKSFNVFDSKILLILLLIPQIKPAYFETIPTLSSVFDVGSVISTGIVLLLFIRYGIINVPSVWTLLFYGVQMISTMVYGSSILFFVRSTFSSLGICLIYCIWGEKNPKLLMRSMRLFEIYIYINLLSIVMFPGGLYTTELYWSNWLLGYKNQQIRTILPILAMCLSYGLPEKKMPSFDCILAIAASLLTFGLIDSATSIIGIVVFLSCYVLASQNEWFNRMLSLKNVVILSVLATIALWTMRYQQYYSFLLENILGRSVNLTNRVMIWDMTAEYISKRWLLGYGLLSYTQYLDLYYHISLALAHPHNLYMYLFMCGGAILISIFFLGVLYADKKVYSALQSRQSIVIRSCLSSFFVMGISESLTGTVLFIPMIVYAMNLDRLQKPEVNSRVMVKIK